MDMVRPQSKDQLYEMIAFERGQLLKAIEQVELKDMATPCACEDWSVKDILSHLTDWEQRGLHWYRAGCEGKVPKTPDEQFNWRQLPALNHQIYLKYRDKDLADVLRDFATSFEETMAAIDAMTEEELFTPGFYAWTGNSLLRDYVNANTASHYRWASKLIKKFIRSLT